MSDHNPFLFVHLPLDEVRPDGRLPDASPHRRNAIARGVVATADAEFGKVLYVPGSPKSSIEFPPWSLDPLAPAATAFTFTTWIKVGMGGGSVTLIDAGFGPGTQRLNVRLQCDSRLTALLIHGPTPLDPVKGLTWTFGGLYSLLDTWMHIALLWDPKGTWNIFINGSPFSGQSGKTDGGPPSKLTGTACFQTYLGKAEIPIRLAHFRIYTRELSQEEIRGDMDDDCLLSYRYRMAHAIDLSLTNQATGRPVLSTQPPGEKMSLHITLAEGEIRTKPPSPRLSTRVNCHFELAFRPGTLAKGSLTGVSVDGSTDEAPSWSVIPTVGNTPEECDSLLLVRNSMGPLPASGLNIVLDHMQADQFSGARGTMVNLLYRNLQDKKGAPIQGSVQQGMDFFPTHLESSSNPTPLRVQRNWSVDGATTPPAWFTDAEGRVHLTGHFYYVLPQGLPEKREWLSKPQIAIDIARASASGEARFSGRVRCYSAGPPALASLWWGDLIITASGAVTIEMTVPDDLCASAARVDVFLNGIAYFPTRFELAL